MTGHPDRVRSTASGIDWPAVPSEPGALLLSAQFELGQTQWWPPEALRRAQFRQLGLLLRHAAETVPFYRERLAAAGFRAQVPVTPELFAAIPIVTRSEIQAQGEALYSGSVPAAHGAIGRGQTSGSTGRPINYINTAVTRLFWQAFNLRDQLWHERDLSATLATIRPYIDEGEQAGWGPSIDLVYASGKSVLLNIGRHDFDEQLDWLRRHAPVYLVSNAYNVYGLARRSLERGLTLPGLREARCYGGTFPDETRAVVRRAWNALLTDTYTAEEVGHIALQCPGRDTYHVQSESLIVEVLDARGRPCRTGEIGRVVLTTLHNYAMPLVRYDIGDYAEVGAPCPCGRGLPVLTRILGRQRNILTLPDGSQRWPSFPSGKWSHVAPVRQVQLVQKSRKQVVARVVADRELTAEEEREFLHAIEKCLGHPFAMALERVAEIPRSASYKFEDFVSEVSA